MSDNQLSGRELSEAVAVRVFEEPQPPALASEACPLMLDRVEPSPKGAWLHVHRFDHGDACEWEPRPFSESIEAAMQVEDRIAELGLQGNYVAALWEVLGGQIGVNFWNKSNFETMWLCTHASAEQRCLAALKAVQEKKG